MGDVIGGYLKRRGQVNGMSDRAGNKIVDAFVPLSEMFGYSTDLRSMTQVELLTLWSLTTMRKCQQILLKRLLRRETVNFN